MPRPRVALVTGVSGHIGMAVAEELHSRGIRVFGIDRALPAEQQWCDAFQQVDLGVGDLPSFSIPVNDLDYVFHVAGGALPGEVESEDLIRDAGLINETVRINFLSALDVIHASLGLIRPGGSITLTSSINALADFGLPVYSASKAALHGLVNAYAPVLSARQIRLNVAALGTVDHPGVRSLHASDPAHFDHLRSELPSHELLTPTSVARAMVRLAVDQISVSGQTVVIDNGQLHAHAAR